MSSQPVVLYVEDDAQSRKILRVILEKRMALPHVTILENSLNFRAVVSALDPKPDIIFLDIHMQPHNGFETLAGFNGCLAKPIDLQTFPEAFNRILAGETIWRITS